MELAALQSALSRRPKLRFGPQNIIKSTLFVAGSNTTLELISTITTAVYFLYNFETLDNPKRGCFSGLSRASGSG